MNNNTNSAVLRRSAIAAATIIWGGLAAPGAVLGQQHESVIVDVGACVNLRSPGERLDCYEEQVQRARARPPAPPAEVQSPAPAAVAAPAAAAPAAQSPAPAVAAVSASPSAPAAGPPVRVENARVARGSSDDESDDAVFEGVIAALRETVPNAYVITLDNGQVWNQDYPKAYRLAVGQRVRIAQGRGFGGGYRLTVIGMGGFIQVERVR